MCLVIDRWPTAANLTDQAEGDAADDQETPSKLSVDSSRAEFDWASIGLTLARSRALWDAGGQPPASGPPDRLASQLEQLAFSEVWSWTCFNYT